MYMHTDIFSGLMGYCADSLKAFPDAIKVQVQNSKFKFNRLTNGQLPDADCKVVRAEARATQAAAY